MFAALVASLLVAGAAAQQNTWPSNCSIPFKVKGQQGIDPLRQTGIWYEYLYRTPGVDDINAKDHYDLVGCYNDYGVMKAAVNWTLAYYSANDPAQPCVGIQGIMNITSDGRKEAHGFTPTPGGLVEFVLELFILYTDYETEFYYSCQQPPNDLSTLKPNDICPNPSFWVRTRTEPSLLTAARKAGINALVNGILANYGPKCSIDTMLQPTGINLTKNPVFCQEAPANGIDTLRATVTGTSPCSAPATTSASPVTVTTQAALVTTAVPVVVTTTAAPVTTAVPVVVTTTAAPVTTAVPVVVTTTAAPVTTAAPKPAY